MFYNISKYLFPKVMVEETYFHNKETVPYYKYCYNIRRFCNVFDIPFTRTNFKEIRIIHDKRGY